MFCLFTLAVTLAVQVPLDLTTIRPTAGPELLVHDREGPLVSLRLSAPADPDLPEGGVELLQELARPGATATADRFGARLEFRHEAGHAVVAVTGPQAAFDAMAALLRDLTTDLDLSVSNLRRARARAEGRVLARLERPEPRVRRVLRHALFGGAEPVGAAAGLLEPEGIRRLQAHLYHPDRLRVTVVGRLPEPVLRSAFAHWAPVGGEGGPPGPPAVDGAADPARPQAHREWAGIGYPVAADPATLAVAVELVQRRLDASPLRSGTALAWHHRERWALALIGATEPGDSVVRLTAGISGLEVRGDGPTGTATGVGRYLRRVIAEARALTGARAVAAASERLRRRMALEAGTPTGRAELIGRLADALGPEAVPGFPARIDRVQPEAVLDLLQQVLGGPAVYVEGR